MSAESELLRQQIYKTRGQMDVERAARDTERAAIDVKLWYL